MEAQQNLPQTTSPNSNLPVDPTAGGATGNLDASDIQIPRLHLLQGLSKGVAEGDFKMGDILHTGNQEVLGGKEAPVIFIPFHVMKVNQKFRTDRNPKEYICTEAWNPQRPWEEEGYEWQQRDGTVIKCKVNNYRTVIVHGIIPSDDEMNLPVSVTFRSSAGKGARAITSHFATVQQFNALKGTSTKPYSVAWELTSEHIKGDGQVYAGWVCKKSRKASAEEIEECDSWAQALNRNMLAYAEHSASQEVASSEGTATATTAQAETPDMDDIPF